MLDELNRDPAPKPSKMRRIATSSLALSIFVSQITPALATIDNTATASGTYSGTSYPSNSSTVNVPVAAPAPSMTIGKVAALPTSGGGTDTTIIDAGDTILYTYTITNTGNVTMNTVAPTDAGPKFNGTAGTGALSAFTPVTASVAPGANQVYTATYTLSQLDVDRGAGIAAGVTNGAGISAKTPAAVAYTVAAPSSGPAAGWATTTIAAGPKVALVKSYTVAHLPANSALAAGTAGLGDTVTYTYTVTNTGNVPMTGIAIADVHAGSVVTAASETLVSEGPLGAPASTDATANNGTWSLLQPGAKVKFTWTYVVTQANIDAG